VGEALWVGLMVGLKLIVGVGLGGTGVASKILDLGSKGLLRLGGSSQKGKASKAMEQPSKPSKTAIVFIPIKAILPGENSKVKSRPSGL
jgi:hypothetical protein